MSIPTRLAAAMVAIAVLVTSSVAFAAKTQTVQVGSVGPYSYKTAFSVNAPQSWKLKTTTHSNEAVLMWTDPTGNALFIVDIVDAKSAMSPAQQKDLLTNFLKTSLGKNPDFKQQAEMSSKGARVVWSYMNAKLNIPIQGESFIGQSGKRLAIVTVGAPSEQWSTLKSELMGLVNSLKVLNGPM